MSDTTTTRVRRILLQGALEAHLGYPEATVGGIPIDHRCPGCGEDRPGCASRLCARRPYDEEENDDE